MRSNIPGSGNLFDDYRIVSAIHNLYFQRLQSDGDDAKIAIQMLQKLNEPNIVQQIVEDEKWLRTKVVFEKPDDRSF